MKILIVTESYTDKKRFIDMFKNVKKVDVICIGNPEHVKSIGLMNYDTVFCCYVSDKVFEILAFRCMFFNKELKRLF